MQLHVLKKAIVFKVTLSPFVRFAESILARLLITGGSTSTEGGMNLTQFIASLM
jgi:hypothetical protein